MSEYIKKLTEAIEAVHECRATHFGTQLVKEMHNGVIIWDGNVEVFQISGHPEVKVAFGWGWEALDGDISYIGILGQPPIETPQQAVKAAILSGQMEIYD